MSNGSSQYQDSQAFNQTLNAKEQLNPATGSLTLSIPLVSLHGVRKDIGLNVSLIYQSGNQGILGMPKNWGFSIPYLLLDDKDGGSLTTQGKTFVIDSNWVDDTGYQSGLKYVNNHGYLFKAVVPPQPLPSGQAGEYAYVMRYGDGSSDYFDILGKLLEHADRFGNYLIYSYNDQFSGVVGNFVVSVTDSYGQKVTFSYELGQMTLITPDQSKWLIEYSDDAIAQITNPLSQKTDITYTSVNQRTVISTIDYPHGACTTLQYVNIPYSDAQGTAQQLPAVGTMVHTDKTKNNAVVSYINYGYGDNSNQYFTGYPKYKMSSSGTDELMDSGDAEYRYDVLIDKCDANGKRLGSSRLWYNYLHSLVVQQKNSVDGRQQVSQVCQIQYTYPVASPDKHAQTPNFDKPKTIVHEVWDNKKQAYVPMSQSEHSYDEFGMPLNTINSIYDRTQQKWVCQNTHTVTYLKTPWGGEMPTKSIVIDNITHLQIQTQFELTTDRKLIAQKNITYSKDNGKTWCAWKQYQYTYNSQGLITAKQYGWSKNAFPKPSGIASTQSQISYHHDSKSAVLAITTTDALGHQSMQAHQVNLPGAPLIETVSPSGYKNSNTVDAMGQLLTQTNANGYVLKNTYSSYQPSTNTNTNYVTTTTPEGYVVQAMLDGLTRQAETLDNGNSAHAATADHRTLGQSVYNVLGLLESYADELGLKTSYQYDSLGRKIKVTDPMGNEQTFVFDDVNMAVTTYINGDKRSTVIHNGLGAVTQIDDYADSGDLGIDYFMRYVLTYDGLGKVINEQQFQVSLKNNSSTLLQQNQRQYDIDGNMIEAVADHYVGTEVTVTKNYHLDLLGNRLNSTKTVTYKGQSPNVTAGSTLGYDALGQLTKQTNVLGKSKTYNYTAEGWLDTLIEIDGTQFKHQYDAMGKLINKKAVDKTGAVDSIDLSYFADGSIKNIIHQKNQLTYQYALDGTFTGVQYGNHLSQTYELDNYSRIIKLTDESNQVTGYAYDEFGQLLNQKHCGDTVNYQYGTLNHTKGMLLGFSLAGHCVLKQTRQLDGWGQVSQQCARDAKGKVIEQNKCSYDVMGRTTDVNTTSEVAPHNNHRQQFTYDGLGQVIQTQYINAADSAETQYVYDGNHNILSVTEAGHTTKFTYNALGQITSPQMVYDTGGRVIKDDKGQQYQYNIWGDLIHVFDAKKVLLSQYDYGADGLLFTHQTSKNSYQHYYRDGQSHAVCCNNKSWTTFISHGHERVSAYVDGKPTYYFVTQGSTSQTMDSDGKDLRSFYYGAYGEARPDSATLSQDRDFTWHQAYHDQGSDLMYLQSRFYCPRLRTFLSPDTYPVDNIYAYGCGDPVNHFDPTGHLPQWLNGFLETMAFASPFGLWSGLAVTSALEGKNTPKALANLAMSTTLGTAAAVVTDGLATPAMVALLGEEVAASTAGSITIATVSGMLGGVTGGMAGQLTNNMMDGHSAGQGLGGAMLMGGIMGGFAGGLTEGIMRGIPGSGQSIEDVNINDSPRRSLCFIAGTLVVTEDGNKPIEDIKIGDRVCSYHVIEKTTVTQEVINVFKNRVTKLIQIDIDGGSVVTTPKHLFYTNKKWLPADKLKVGDELVDIHRDSMPITSISHKDKSVEVYNFEVANTHNYYISRQKILTHNMCKNRQAIKQATDRPESNNPYGRSVSYINKKLASRNIKITDDSTGVIIDNVESINKDRMSIPEANKREASSFLKDTFKPKNGLDAKSRAAAFFGFGVNYTQSVIARPLGDIGGASSLGARYFLKRLAQQSAPFEEPPKLMSGLKLKNLG